MYKYIYIYVYICIYLLCCWLLALPQKRLKSIDRKMSITPWGELPHFFLNLIFKKKQSCFTFSFAYEEIRKSVKKEVRRGPGGVPGDPGRVRERFGGGHVGPKVSRINFLKVFDLIWDPRGSSRRVVGEVFLCIFDFFGGFHATCLQKSIFHRFLNPQGIQKARFEHEKIFGLLRKN